jgi:uncharacterized membrane protein YfcA
VHLSGPELTVALAAVVAGAVVQGSIGFGINLVAVPVVAVLEPDALPATLVVLALPLAAGMLVREHGHVDRRGLAWLLLGRLPGTALGAWVVTILPRDGLSSVIGALVLAGVLMSVVTPPLHVTPTTATLVGLASGTMGTASSIGGPPVALLYQHHAGAVLRSTTAAVFTIGTVLSTAALAVAGEVAGWHLLLAATLTPGVAAGLALARLLHDRLDRGWLRPTVLAVAAVAGAVVIARATFT